MHEPLQRTAGEADFAVRRTGDDAEVTGALRDSQQGRR